MAIVSILHRLSGLLLALLIPVLLYFLSCSLKSEESFNLVKLSLSGTFSKALVWLVLSALMYHLLAGIRHMIMDLGVGESVSTAKTSSWLLIILVAALSLTIGVWLW
jgi:succinate dehydrogenase / fumarate reductase cytochrome b subunit